MTTLVKISQYAPMLAARTAVGVTVRSVTETEGECEGCEFVGDMEFVEEDAETSAAECPECGDRVTRYIGPDVD